jgi:hypothetical protein
VIIEDSIKGTTAGYNQSNAYAGGANGVMGGYETKPNPVPAAQMQYDHVAKAIAPDFNGIPNAYPASVTANSNYIHNFSFNTTGWNKNKLHIVSLFIAPDGKIDNAASTTVDQAVANGYVVGLTEKKITPSFMTVYPNPANNIIQLQINSKKYQSADLLVTDINGKIIMKKVTSIHDGVNLFPISLAGLASGNYLIVVDMDGDTQTTLFTKE